MANQQIYYAQYGNSRSYYGNIAYGQAPKLLQVYGAWPEEKPVQAGMLVEDWQDEAPVTPVTLSQYENEISSRIEIIKNLKAQVEAEQDLKAKNEIREQLRIEREAKERAFKLKALIDEEEATFILFN